MTIDTHAPRPQELQPGDILLYSGTGLMSALIRFKTGSHFSHVEVFDRYEPGFLDAVVLASRDGKGVRRYIYTTVNLRAVLRPMPALTELEMLQGRRWFTRGDGEGGPVPNGQGYDWLGLLSFYSAKLQGSDKPEMFCSEFVSRFYKKCGRPLFLGDSDGIAPGDFWKCPLLHCVWIHPASRDLANAERRRERDW